MADRIKETIIQDLSEGGWSKEDLLDVAMVCCHELRELKKQGFFDNDEMEKMLNDLRSEYWPKDSKNPL